MRNFAWVFLFYILGCTIVYSQVSIGSRGQKQVELKNYDLFMVKERMIGTFSSLEQSAADPSYLHVNAMMKPIWTHRRDGYWLYIEQAYADDPNKPYRQRIYHLYRKDSKTIVSQVYQIKNANRYAGEWKKAVPFARLTPDSLETKTGCVVYLHKNDLGEFWGSTPGKGCITKYNGASYVTSEVFLSEEQFMTWDRGFNLQDKQVWGAFKGGYRFKKIADDIPGGIEDRSYDLNTRSFQKPDSLPPQGTN